MIKFKSNIRKLSVAFFAMIVIATAMVVSVCGQTVVDIKETRLFIDDTVSTVSTENATENTTEKEY